MRDCAGFSGRLTRAVLGAVIDREVGGVHVPSPCPYPQLGPLPTQLPASNQTQAITLSVCEARRGQAWRLTLRPRMPFWSL